MCSSWSSRHVPGLVVVDRLDQRVVGVLVVDIGTEVVAVVDQDRRGPGDHIVRVALDPVLPAFSQVTGF